MAKFDVNIAEIRKLVELVENHHLDELTVEEGDLNISVKGRPSPPLAVPIHAAAPLAHEAVPVHEEEAPEEPAAEAEELEGNIFDVTAALVGVFYRAPSPDAPSFVEVGDIVEVGSELGLIEAMKVFSPIPSEVAGTVVAIPADNGKLVREGDVLVRIRVSEE